MLVEYADVTIGKQVHFKGFEFDARFIGDVTNTYRSVVGETGLGTYRTELSSSIFDIVSLVAVLVLPDFDLRQPELPDVTLQTFIGRLILHTCRLFSKDKSFSLLQSYQRKMVFERLPPILSSDELIEIAFKRGSKIKGKGSDGGKVTVAANTFIKHLGSVSKKYPNFDALPEFYRELADLIAGVDNLRKDLSSIGWAADRIEKILREYKFKIRRAGKKSGMQGIHRKAAYGRMASIVREISGSIERVNEARELLRKIPTLEDLPTVVVAGHPNVGKSSIVNSLSTARIKVASYPFTTKNVSIGNFIHGDTKYQLVDTPGLLDRPNKGNVEVQAVLALRHVGDLILFLIDTSGSSGYTTESQLNLLEDVRLEFAPRPILVARSKDDLSDDEDGVWDLSVSIGDPESMMKLKNALLDALDSISE